MLRARDITLFLHNRYGVAFFMLFAVAAVIYALTAGIVTPLQGDYGLVVTSPNNWLQSGTASTALSIVMNSRSSQCHIPEQAVQHYAFAFHACGERLYGDAAGFSGSVGSV